MRLLILVAPCLSAGNSQECDQVEKVMSNRTIEDLKRRAKRIAQTSSATHQQALDTLAKQAGYSHWGAYQVALKRFTPPPISYQSLYAMVLHQNETAAQRIEAFLTTAQPVLLDLVKGIPGNVRCIVEEHYVDWSENNDSRPIPPQIYDLQSK